MAFDVQKFMTTNFDHREMEVKITDKALLDFFPKDEEPIWIVRGLTGEEMARLRSAVELNSSLGEIVERLMSPKKSEKIDAMMESIGVSTRTPDDLVKRITALKFGTVSPKFEDGDLDINHSFFVKIADVAPIAFYDLTNKIFELTGDGKVGK